MFVAFYDPEIQFGSWLMITETPPTNCALMSEETEPMIDVAGDWKQFLLKYEVNQAIS